MDQGEFVRMKRHVRRYSRVLLAARDLLQVEAAAMLELFWHVREIEHIETPPAPPRRRRGIAVRVAAASAAQLSRPQKRRASGIVWSASGGQMATMLTGEHT